MSVLGGARAVGAGRSGNQRHFRARDVDVTKPHSKQIKAHGKENEVMNINACIVAEPPCCPINQNNAVEIVDDDEYEAIEISLRLAEKLLEVHRPTIPQHEIVNGVRSGVHTTDLNKKSLHHREKLINSAPRLEPMSAGTDEYEQVRELFSRSCKNFTVLHIERFVLFRVYRTKILCLLTSSPVWTQCCRSPPSAQI